MKPRIVLTPALFAAVAFLFVATTVRAVENSTGLKIAAPKPAKTVWISHEAGEVLKLVRANVAHDVVMAFIKNSKTGFNLSADEIIQLHNEGVSDEIIGEMLARKKQTPRPIIISTPEPAPQQTAPPQQQMVQQPAAIITQPTVTYVQPQTVYVPAPTTYVYRAPAYSDYDSYPHYWRDHSYPRFTINFGFGHHHHFRGHHHFGRHHFGHHRSFGFHGRHHH